MDSAALAHFLKSGAVPTEAQALELRRLLDAGEAEISQLDQTAATLSLILAEVKLQSSRRSDYLAPLRGALSALRRFPAEILGNIFVMCAEHTRTGTSSIGDPCRAPMLLGHVCSHWRVVSHGLPRLWDRVVVPTASVVNIDTASVVRDLLARSQSLPLSLSILNLVCSPWGAPYIPPVGNSTFFRILWESHLRLTDITLDITRNQIAQLTPVIFAQETLFPTLAFFTLTVLFTSEARNPGTDIHGVLDGFRNAPSLSSLDISCVDDIPLSLSTFPWSQLQKLRVDMELSFHDARNLLMQCSQLESARFYFIERGFQDTEDSTGVLPTSMRNLRELYFAVESDVPSTVFFEAFTFPNLEKLYMDVGELSTQTFQRFYTRSNFELRHLHLERVSDMCADDLFAFIRCNPTLQGISIINCQCAAEAALFEIFTHHAAPSWRPIALPALATLAISLDYEQEGSAVADMAECLSEHGGRDSPFPVLERLYLETHSYEPDSLYGAEVEARLDAVATTGFLVRRTSANPGDITPYEKENGRWV